MTHIHNVPNIDIWFTQFQQCYSCSVISNISPVLSLTSFVHLCLCLGIDHAVGLCSELLMKLPMKDLSKKLLSHVGIKPRSFWMWVVSPRSFWMWVVSTVIQFYGQFRLSFVKWKRVHLRKSYKWVKKCNDISAINFNRT